MYPDDRVLVGVINRKRDLNHLLQSHWYRIPQEQMPDGIYTEYLAFYLSRSAASELEDNGIAYYGRRSGTELVYRRDILPEEPDHKNADKIYYQIKLHSVEERTSPITNPGKRPISFIFTTWDRFVKAQVIADLYSDADYFVDRIYHALRDKRLYPENQTWEAQKRDNGYGAGFRVICERGTLNAYTDAPENTQNLYQIDLTQPQDEILREIETRIASMGGPVTLPISPF